MQTIVVTGAAGGIGTRLRKLLKGVYPQIRWSDIATPADLRGRRELREGRSRRSRRGREDWSRARRASCISAAFRSRARGRRSSTPISSAATICSRPRAAKRVKRVVFASSNHAVGFYPRSRKIGVDAPVRADQPLWRQQGVRRGARLALCLQAWTARDLSAHRQCRRPADEPATAVDLAAARGSRAADPHRPRTSRYPLRDFLRHLRQRAGLLGQRPRPRATAIGQKRRPKIIAMRRWPRKQNCRPIRSATGIRADRSAATNSTAASSARRT